MTAHSALATALKRQSPPAGGFSPAIVRLEVRRLLRNRRTMMLALILPVLFFVGFGLNKSYVHERAGHGNVSAVEMISIALYGAVAATAACGAMVSIERVAGWSRQLRVTPLSPAAYVVIKMLTSLVLAAGEVWPSTWSARYEQGGDAGGSVGYHRAVRVGRIAAVRRLRPVHRLPAAHRERRSVPHLVLTLCSFAGGLFIPFSQFSPDLQTFARFTPLYGLASSSTTR